MQLVDDRLTVGRPLVKSGQLLLDPAQPAGQLAQACGIRTGRFLVHFAHGCHPGALETSQKACLTRWNGTSPDYFRKSGISLNGASGRDYEVSLSRARARRGVWPWRSTVREGRWKSQTTSKRQCLLAALVQLTWVTGLRMNCAG